MCESTEIWTKVLDSHWKSCYELSVKCHWVYLVQQFALSHIVDIHVRAPSVSSSPTLSPTKNLSNFFVTCSYLHSLLKVLSCRIWNLESGFKRNVFKSDQVNSCFTCEVYMIWTGTVRGWWLISFAAEIECVFRAIKTTHLMLLYYPGLSNFLSRENVLNLSLVLILRHDGRDLIDASWYV